MDKLKMHSINGISTNVEMIKKIFPNCVVEAKDSSGKLSYHVDFDLLKQELSDSLVEGNQERYQINWPGKREALLAANAPIAKTLRPVRDESVDFDRTKNIFIEGDNLDALKLLQETYLGKVKLIYIDPPYNTGNDFLYDDDFSVNADEFLTKSNQKDESGVRLVANTDSNGRFHSDWLSMMYSRVKLARNLLAEDGLIMISIDDSELNNLRKICDEVFGEENFIDNLIWKKRYGGGAKEKYLVTVHEYVLIFAKNEAMLNVFTTPLTEESIKRYYTLKDQNFSVRGPYRTHPLEATKSMGERKNLVYGIPGPDGKEIQPKRQWLWSQDRALEAAKNGELEFVKSKDGTFSVHTKQYLKDENGVMREGKPFSLIDDVYTQHGTNEIIDIFGNAQIFSFPKPSEFVRKLVEIGTSGKGEEIVLDFFAGSGTTAHAVAKANKQDGGNRRFILVQIPEECDPSSEAYKAGYKKISDVTKERVRRISIEQTNDLLSLGSQSGVDQGFRVLTIDSSNMAEVYYNPDAISQDLLSEQEDNVRSDRTAEDLLFQVILDWGVDLALPISTETIQGKSVFFVDDNALIACFDKKGEIDENFVKELAKRQPLRVVFRDAGFKSDSVKINVEQIFKLLSPSTEVKCI